MTRPFMAGIFLPGLGRPAGSCRLCDVVLLFSRLAVRLVTVSVRWAWPGLQEARLSEAYSWARLREVSNFWYLAQGLACLVNVEDDADLGPSHLHLQDTQEGSRGLQVRSGCAYKFKRDSPEWFLKFNGKVCEIHLPHLLTCPLFSVSNLSKKRKFVADGVFYAELNEFLKRELAEV